VRDPKRFVIPRNSSDMCVNLLVLRHFRKLKENKTGLAPKC